MNAVITVDGGGSRCRLRAFSENGEVLATSVVEAPASLRLGVALAWSTISEGLAELRSQLGVPDDWAPLSLMLGLAGALPKDRRAELGELVPAHWSCSVFTDGYAQLTGACGGEAGICLALGTGSVVHWLDSHGGEGMAGGWGYPVGDEGSGAWMGKRLLQRYVWHRDGQTRHSSLMPVLDERLGSSIGALQQWTTETQSTKMATLAPLVLKHAEAGDSLALGIVNEAVQCCLALIELAPDDLPVVIVGGLGEQLLPEFKPMLGHRLQQAKGDALYGLWLLSRQRNAQMSR